MSERPTARAHREAAAVIRDGDRAIDATAGNGYDTVFLASRVGDRGETLAFDIQPAAIASARARVEAEGFAGRVRFVQASHATLADHAAPASIAAILFNLGYLPGGDHAIVTRPEETLHALEASLSLLRPGGLLSVVCYPGHAGGDTESEAVTSWANSLGAPFSVEIDRRLDTLRPAPFLVLIRRDR